MALHGVYVPCSKTSPTLRFPDLLISEDAWFSELEERGRIEGFICESCAAPAPHHTLIITNSLHSAF